MDSSRRRRLLISLLAIGGLLAFIASVSAEEVKPTVETGAAVFSVSFYDNIVKPDRGASWQLNLTMTFLFPQ